MTARPPAAALPAAGEGVDVADRLAVADVLQRYAWGVDHKRWDLVRACFHDDAVDHHGGNVVRVEEFMAWVRRRHEHVVEAVHALSNLVVWARDDGRLASEATCALYQAMDAGCGETLQAYGLGEVDGLPVGTPGMAAPGVAVEMTGWCRYADVLETRPGAGLRVAERRVTFVRVQAVRTVRVDTLR